MKKPSLTEIENAFLPAKEIDSADRFSGRKQAVADTLYALISEGSHLAIVGNRGIGKTSLARQVENLASGNNEILKKLDIQFDSKLDFLTIYLACGSQISSTEELLERLLATNPGLNDWIYDIPVAKKTIETYSPKFTAKIFNTGAELGATKTSETSKNLAHSNHSIDTVFTTVVNAISQSGITKNGVLIVIDEFDQIEDPSGFASILKALATNAPKVKFCIVGVAKDIQTLMKEHESSDRLFSGSIISMEPMDQLELGQIIDSAEKQINGYIAFQSEAKEEMIKLANGHPYMIHLIGKYTLRIAYQGNKSNIGVADVNTTLASIAERKADPVLEGKYRKAVASSAQREIVLKALARVQDSHNEIWTTNAYKIALELGVDNSSQYVGQLVSIEYGAEIEKIRERFYRFRDSLFHAYVLARPYMYSPQHSS